MIDQLPCPVCRGTDWREIAHCVLLRGEPLPDGLPNPDYVRERMAVVFQIWFPDRDQVVFTTQSCERCGFVLFSPRPDEQDLDRKYRFLLEHQHEPLGGHSPQAGAAQLNAQRAARVYRDVGTILPRHIRGNLLHVLDFGGGTGQLLVPFLSAGHRCDLVDYCQQPLPGVHKVGDRLRDLPTTGDYDVAICSHVLEHLADPAAALQQLGSQLRPGGVLYAEVPLEVWGRLTVRWDPVTHVNFFNVWNLAAIVAEQGFQLVATQRRTTTYNGGRIEAAVVMAHRTDGVHADASERLEALYGSGLKYTQRALRPGIVRQVARRIRLHQWPRISSLRRTFLPRA